MNVANPWNIESIYDFLYFNCPSCIFKNHLKQAFINHAYEMHPDSIEHLFKVNDGSLSDIIFPNIKEEISEEIIRKESTENPLDLEKPDTKPFRQYDSEEIGISYIEPITEIMEGKCETEDSEYVLCENNESLKKLTKKTKNDMKYENNKKGITKSQKCEYCGEIFPNKMALNQHKSEFHKDIKEFPCENCKKAFTRKAALKKHIEAVHEGIRNHVCNICGKALSTISMLKAHIKYVHDDEKARPYSHLDKVQGKTTKSV